MTYISDEQSKIDIYERDGIFRTINYKLLEISLFGVFAKFFYASQVSFLWPSNKYFKRRQFNPHESFIRCH